MVVSRVRLNGRDLGPHKALVEPSYGARSVLTQEPWAFVRLSLKRNRQAEALFYWEQAKAFHDAAVGLPLESAPLLLYYSYMNAAKALLVAKKVPFDPHHGVREWKKNSNRRDWLKRIGVRFKSTGVAPALANYFGDAESGKEHSLQELFFNMAFIHRTYCLTYRSQRDMFVPLRDCAFVGDSASGSVHFSARLSRDHSLGSVVRRLPKSFVPDPSVGPGAIRSQGTVAVTRLGRLSGSDLNAIVTFHRRLRADLFYINGTQTLWYVKLTEKSPTRLARHTPTLVLAAMHRLSELCCYKPMDFATYLSGSKNWLLHEFIGMSTNQYVDEIASEITGHQFLIPNVRPAA